MSSVQIQDMVRFWQAVRSLMTLVSSVTKLRETGSLSSQ